MNAVPVLVEGSPFPVLRAARPSYPLDTAQGASCYPVSNACFTSQYTKDEARSMCDSGRRPQKDPRRGCPIGSPRIDPYGSGSGTSADQFDPCMLRDLPVCEGNERFGDQRRFGEATLEYQGIFGVEQEERVQFWNRVTLYFLGGLTAGYLIGRAVK